MKRKNISALLALTILVSASCNNDLKVLAPYKNVTVAYGLLDQNDAIHYIRINKAFEGSGNAYQMAQQYDSIYYPVNQIQAVLEDSDISTNTIVKTYTLDTTTTIPLSPGIFSYPKQLLYYTNATLNQNDYYNLVITNTKTGQKITGSTSLLPDVDFTNPTFISTKTFFISFSNQSPTNVEWTTSSNVRIYQMTIRFYYDELYQSNRTAKSLDWVFAAVTAPTAGGGSTMEYAITIQGLFNLILSAMGPETGVTRMQDSVGVIFTSGSDDFNTYVQLSQPPLGINQDVPTFSNLKNGVGLYTSRHVQSLFKQLATVDLDSLDYGSQTGNLGFVPYQH